MDRITLILQHPHFLFYCKKNKEFEKGRKYCKHNFNHFTDVARIAYIYNLEQNWGFSKELIYACALLHDIGKWKQYQDGTPHNESSAVLAEKILKDCSFSEQESAEILSAILTHRNDKALEQKNTLNWLIYMADKKSRPCFFCKKEPDCNWKQEQKNQTLEY